MTRNSTIYFQVAMVVLAAMNQYESVFPQAVSKFVPFALLVVSGVQAIIAHNYTPQGDKIVKLPQDGEMIVRKDVH